MKRIEAIHYFAREYLYLFINPNTKLSRLKSGFAERCADLGLENDNGKSFIEKYTEDAFYKSESLKLIIETVDNVDLLGSAIYSHWYYDINNPELFLSDQDRIWYMHAFSRLMEITDKVNDGADEKKDLSLNDDCFEYLICNEYNKTVFNKLCKALEEDIPNLRKSDLLTDVDNSQVQIYYLGLDRLTVHNGRDWFDEVYIKSEFDLDDYYDGNANLVLKRKAGCLYDENLVFGIKNDKNS